MSVFTNPAASAGEQPSAYVAAILDLVGDENPLDILRRSPGVFQERIRPLPAATLRRPEAPGKWSIAQVLQHLADSELVWAYRVRMILTHDRPPLIGYDQDLFADRLKYRDADAHEALALFTAVRGANLRLLDQASEADLHRVGLHEERGEESVASLIRLNAGHDIMHLRQIDRIRGE
jgi:uncharacterized damage-inducible protein DinB